MGSGSESKPESSGTSSLRDSLEMEMLVMSRLRLQKGCVSKNIPAVGVHAELGVIISRGSLGG